MGRVLLTGAAGFIGTHVRAVASAAGHDVLCLDSLRPDVHRNRPCPVDDLMVADVRDDAAVARALRGVDVVVHLAAKVGLGVDVHDYPDYAANNMHGTAVLLSEMTRAGVSRLVLASSMVVYGEGVARCAEHGRVVPAPRLERDLADGRFEPGCPACGRSLVPLLVGEDVPPNPRNGYAASKLAQENLATSWARETGASATILRYHNVYGPGLPAGTPYAGVAALFLDMLRHGSAPAVNEDGRMRRDFIHVRDVATATVAAAEQAHGVRTFNVGSGVVRTVGDLAAAMSDATGGPAPRVTGRFRLGDVRHITADSTRIRAELEWAPSVDFRAAIAELATDQAAVTLP
jgi:dTDP-L-rhamnose 4-epimerase